MIAATNALVQAFDNLSQLPVWFAYALCRLATAMDLRLIQLVTPTTPRDRALAIARSTTGFLYYVSVAGITGERRKLPPELARWTNQRPYQRDMAEFRVFDPDLNAIDLSQHSGFEVDYDRWENARGSALSTQEHLAD